MKQLGPTLAGTLTAWVLNVVVFAVLDPAPGSTGATQANLVTMAAVVTAAVLALALASVRPSARLPVVVYQGLFAGLTVSVLLWDARAPSTMDGSAAFRWFFAIGCAFVCLAVVFAIDKAMSRIGAWTMGSRAVYPVPRPETARSSRSSGQRISSAPAVDETED